MPNCILTKIEKIKKAVYALLVFLFKILILPFLILISILSPFFRAWVAIFVPTIHGIFNSLETIAAWHNIPPKSVITALAFIIAGKKLASVSSVTKMSPFLIFEKLFSLKITLAIPVMLFNLPPILVTTPFISLIFDFPVALFTLVFSQLLFFPNKSLLKIA